MYKKFSLIKFSCLLVCSALPCLPHRVSIHCSTERNLGGNFRNLLTFSGWCGSSACYKIWKHPRLHSHIGINSTGVASLCLNPWSLCYNLWLCGKSCGSFPFGHFQPGHNEKAQCSWPCPYFSRFPLFEVLWSGKRVLHILFYACISGFYYEIPSIGAIRINTQVCLWISNHTHKMSTILGRRERALLQPISTTSGTPPVAKNSSHWAGGSCQMLHSWALCSAQARTVVFLSSYSAHMRCAGPQALSP